MSHAKAFEDKNLNTLDFINEFAISATLYWKFIYATLSNQNDIYF